MTFVAVLLLAQLPAQPAIERDSYGVPHIIATDVATAWREAGYAVAQDRMWQMELSRRLARGKMAEVMGTSFAASDKEVLLTGYTDQELQSQVDKLSPSSRLAFESYSAGVNDFLKEGKLPDGYTSAGFQPEPWSPLDTAAISVRLLQYFGRGGAGEIRNMALLGYLQGRKEVKGRLLDVLDDFLWSNDPSSPTTIFKEDEAPNHPSFPPPARAVTEAHLAMLPKLSLIDLLPGLSLAQRDTSTRLAERLHVPFHTGSYCMVVGGKRSATGFPALLSGPQMGFTSPNIVHEMSIQAPGINIVGMDLPGVPGVLVGHTRSLAWGITSGVADTDDIVFFKRGAGGLEAGREIIPVQTIARPLKVKGADEQTVKVERCPDGPVIMSTHGFAFARHSSYWMRELESYDAIAGLWSAKNASEADSTASKGTMSFNVFFATVQGDIGFRYAGLVPIRSNEIDPRFPTPGDPRFRWKGMIPPDQMPHVLNPRGGLLTNWNNKPVSWWPNWDTPVWGKIFRVDQIRRNLTRPKLGIQDFELAAWTIARSDETWPFFEPHVDASPGTGAMAGFDGRLLEGSRQALVYKAFISELRKSLFQPSVGNFIAPQYFDTAAQPSVMLAALERRTHFDYLNGRDPKKVVKNALAKAAASLPAGHDPARYHPGGIPVPGEPSIPYSNRGTYIQVVELLPDGPSGRNVLPPGIAESGPHSKDQAPLSRAWIYKPMHRPW